VGFLFIKDCWQAGEMGKEMPTSRKQEGAFFQATEPGVGDK